MAITAIMVINLDDYGKHCDYRFVVMRQTY